MYSIKSDIKKEDKC